MKQLIGILHWAVVMSLSSTKNKVCQFCISSKKEKEVSTPSPTPAFLDQSNAGEVTAWKNCYLKSKMQNLKLLKILKKKICLHWLKKRICCRQISDFLFNVFMNGPFCEQLNNPCVWKKLLSWQIFPNISLFYLRVALECIA